MPAVTDPDLLIVLTVVMTALATTGLLAGWAEGRLSWAGLFAAVLALAGAVLVVQTVPVSWTMVPEAFLEIVARILR